MVQSITEILQSASGGAVALPLAFVLGLVSALASACCTLPVMGMLVAYSATRENTGRREAVVSAISFLIGTIVALVVLGFVAGLVGQTAQEQLGKYWRMFAGIAAVLLGMAALRVPPLKLPRLARVSGHPRDSLTGIAGPAVAGLLMGGGVAACSLPCNPGIFIVLGAAVLQGHAVWGMVLMSAFAVGFGLPLSAILLGVSFGKASLGAQRAETAIRAVAGVLLVCAGFYLLATA